MNDGELSLRNLLNLSAEEIKNSKICLSAYNYKENKYFYDIWQESNKKFVDFSYYNSKKRKNFISGQIVFGFVQIPKNNKKWVLITVGKILKSCENDQICDYEKIEKYNGMLGRLYIELAPGHRFGFVYNLNRYIDQAKVISIDDKNKDIVKFKGFNNVNLTYKELCLVLSNENSDYYKILNNIKGVYCLTDLNTGKLYIGSASGNEGIAKRWKDYIISDDGGNKELISLKRKDNGNYIKNNFTFTLLEFFDMNVSRNYILNREKYWKRVFDTIKHGYNNN